MFFLQFQPTVQCDTNYDGGKYNNNHNSVTYIRKDRGSRFLEFAG
jgi:hypothetical protein